jgi:hypothetical protein
MPDHADADEALAAAAGLHLAWERHRDDVREAIRGMAALRAGFARPTDPAAEPSPPYAAPGGGAPRGTGA